MQFNSIHVASVIDGVRGYVCRDCEPEAIRLAQEDLSGVIGYDEMNRRDIERLNKKAGKSIHCSLCRRKI